MMNRNYKFNRSWLGLNICWISVCLVGFVLDWCICWVNSFCFVCSMFLVSFLIVFWKRWYIVFFFCWNNVWKCWFCFLVNLVLCSWWGVVYSFDELMCWLLLLCFLVVFLYWGVFEVFWVSYLGVCWNVCVYYFLG